MAQRLEMTDAERTVLVSVCATISATMAATLLAHGLPCPPTAREAIAKSIAESMTDAFFAGRLDLSKFN